MPQALATVALLLASSVALAQPSLRGTWASDAERSTAFNRQFAHLEERTQLFLQQILGRATVEFTPTHVVLNMPDVETTSPDGKKSVPKGFSERRRYRIVSTTPTQVVVETTQPITGARVATVYTFDGPDVVWVYLASPGFDRLHAREYFSRVARSTQPR